MKKVLVFDFGASSGRALLCGVQNKTFCSTEIHRFQNNPIYSGDTLYWDIDCIFREVSKAMEKAQSYDFDAVSVDTWGVDFALMDKDGEFVMRPVHYRDKRNTGMARRVSDNVIPAGELYKRTGIVNSDINTIFQLYAIQQSQPALLAASHRMLMMPDLINFYLTGEMKNEYTEATTTGLIDPKTKNWDWELIQRMGFPKEIFGEIIRPGEICGYLKPDFTNQTIPVIAAPGHDTAAAVIATPSVERDFAFISCGTWALCGTELYSPIINDAAMEAGLTNEGGHDGTVTFLKNITGTWFLQECRRYYNRRGEAYTYNDLEAFARSAPHFAARIDPNDPIFMTGGDIPQRVMDYCEHTGQQKPKTVSQIIRTIYESLAAEFAKTIGQLEAVTGKSYPAVHMFGGGSKDKLLCQMTADACGRLVVSGPSEATAIGNAISTLIALGEIENVKEARDELRASSAVREFYPENHKEWEEYGKAH